MRDPPVGVFRPPEMPSMGRDGTGYPPWHSIDCDRCLQSSGSDPFQDVGEPAAGMEVGAAAEAGVVVGGGTFLEA